MFQKIINAWLGRGMPANSSKITSHNVLERVVETVTQIYAKPPVTYTDDAGTTTESLRVEPSMWGIVYMLMT
jgi:hypothetical protein